MGQGAVEKHQVAGVDDRERGFNRMVELHSLDGAYRATLHYEKVLVHGLPGDTTADALQNLVRALQDKGYRQIRSCLCFRGQEYLGSQEPWVEYLDPAPPSLVASLFSLVRRVLRG